MLAIVSKPGVTSRLFYFEAQKREDAKFKAMTSQLDFFAFDLRGVASLRFTPLFS
jgi:hypothetical protein